MNINPKRMLFMKSNGGTSGASKGGKGTKSQTAPMVMIQGQQISQAVIDANRGTRDHMQMKSTTWQDIQADYARIGVTISEEQAKKIYTAVRHFTFLHDTKMRKAWKKEQDGRSLTPLEQKELEEYKLCAEYCKIAPTIPSSNYDYVYRGIKFSSTTPEYAQRLVSLKVGDSWDVDGMPTSFSTSFQTAKYFSMNMTTGTKGIVVHMPNKTLKNAPSIKGISHYPGENEVFVADYNWKISSISDQRTTGDGYYHLYLEPGK